ncbi:uncharacterized [Tachysurus ichikawai]
MRFSEASGLFSFLSLGCAFVSGAVSANYGIPPARWICLDSPAPVVPWAQGRDEAQVSVWVKTREGRASLANVRFDGGRKIISEELKDGFYVRCLVSCGTRSPGMFAV